MAVKDRDLAMLPERRNAWVRPSLSRDFALLALAITFIMLLILAWVTWITYLHHSENITHELEAETDRIERILESEVNTASYLLLAMSRQLAAMDTHDLKHVARLLQTYASGNSKYAIWAWTNDEDYVVVTSHTGIMETPIKVHDREYVKNARMDPWIPYTGTPIVGRVSGRWVIPISVGVADTTGKYLGTFTVSLDINSVTEHMRDLIWREGVSFAIFSKALDLLTVSAGGEPKQIMALPAKNLAEIDLKKNMQGVLSRGALMDSSTIYAYYRVSNDYPYIIVVGYDPLVSENLIRGLLWPRLAQIGIVALFMLALLWVIRSRVIAPALELSHIAAQVAAGHPFRPLTKSMPLELEHLSVQIKRIADYITERHRLEDELRNKLSMMQQRSGAVQTELQQRAALFAILLREHKQALQAAHIAVQALQDQVHGPITPMEYRSIAGDIYQYIVSLELMVRKLIALSRVDAAAVFLRDEQVPLSAAIQEAIEFIQEDANFTIPEIRTDHSLDILLRTDDAHVRQAFSYALLYLIAQPHNETPIIISCRRISARRGEEVKIVMMGYGDPMDISDQELMIDIETIVPNLRLTAEDMPLAALHLALAFSMFRLQRLSMAVILHKELPWIIVRIPEERCVYPDEPEADIREEDII